MYQLRAAIAAPSATKTAMTVTGPSLQRLVIEQ